jgi:hypothetical protein
LADFSQIHCRKSGGSPSAAPVANRFSGRRFRGETGARVERR